MAEEKMQLEDWLDDLCVRFIINLPEEDLSSVARICFQIEEAQWFYEDFVRPLDPTLPSMTLRSFSLRIFQHCPLLAPFSIENHTKAFEEFLQYKTRVPVRGAILLNEAMDSTILVKGWKKGANWSFPRGKINKDEDDLECAIREVYEETGYDLHGAGLVPENRDVKYIEVTMREQQLRLYVFRNVPMDTYFQPRTRKEISKIQWYKLSELPAFRKKGAQNQNDAAAAANANKFYMVAPFLVPLKKWVVQQKKKDAVKVASEQHFQPHPLHDELVTEDDVWQTEPVTDASTRTPALDTLEGATKELQRLLKVQPAAAQAISVPVSSNAGGDKGASLLAILQAKSRDSSQAVPAAQVPHTPLDHTMAEMPSQPRSPHGQHHPQQRAPLASYQAPPGFPVAPDGTPQQWAFSQSGNAGLGTQTRQHDPLLVNGLAYGHPQPPLRHPQPLPPQVQKSLLSRGAFVDTTTPPPPKRAQGTVNQTVVTTQYQQTQYQPQQTQNMLYQPKPPAGQLSNQSLALLGVLKSETKDVDPDGTQAHSAQSYSQSSPVSIQQSMHGQGIVQAYGQPQLLNAGPVPPHPNLASKQRGQQPVDPAHRSALLNMFKKPEISSPPANQPAELPATTASAALLKGVSTTRGNNQDVPSPVFQTRGTQPVSSSPLSRPPQGPADSSPQVSLRNLSLHPQPGRPQHQSPQSMGGYSPRTAENRNLYQQGANNSLAAFNYSPHMHPGQTLQPADNMNKSTGPRGSSVVAALAAGTDKPASLASPPAASALPAPASLQRKPEMSTEQRQKLLSLFGKPQSPSPGPGYMADDKGKAREMLPPDMTGMRSRVASLASASGQGVPEGVPESRRGSQTPISPADRSFLLGYLASVANNGK
ncbi:decapping enzyme dcp2 [Colletotrichum karsti]|uniref:Decapping enzyme dcp2 n=1 Tax=Colletotrichum karsti TaxID=1095194 RepID=A0A9P6I295_9PEZI|nr:decapping enzyme dcp2 [Colletotrichum karsti]KAF9875637.1 decapping enzyme dcp2 [Colletotrichum karsti]